MAYTAHDPLDLDAKSPIKDSVWDLFRTNLDHLKSALTDGASATQEITGSRATLAGSGTALTVTNNAQVSGTLQVTGAVTTNVFFSTEQIYQMMNAD